VKPIDRFGQLKKQTFPSMYRYWTSTIKPFTIVIITLFTTGFAN
jgi:hypothetical protein